MDFFVIQRSNDGTEVIVNAIVLDAIACETVDSFPVGVQIGWTRAPDGDWTAPPPAKEEKQK